MQKMMFEYISGLIFSALGFVTVICIYSLLEAFGLVDGGGKDKIIESMLLGLSAGILIGFIIVDKFYLKINIWLTGIILTFIASIIGIFMGFCLLDTIGGEFIFVLPLLVVLLCTFAYNIWQFI